jgi:hypothetical protein
MMMIDPASSCSEDLWATKTNQLPIPAIKYKYLRKRNENHQKQTQEPSPSIRALSAIREGTVMQSEKAPLWCPTSEATYLSKNERSTVTAKLWNRSQRRSGIHFPQSSSTINKNYPGNASFCWSTSKTCSTKSAATMHAASSY